MNPCETHEIALERRARADLPEAESAPLEAHLTDCAACRGYAREIERMQTMIQTANATVTPARTWRRVNKYVVRREEQLARRMNRLIPIGMTLMGLLLVMSLIDGTRWTALFAAGGLASGAAQLLAILLRQRRLRRLAESPADLFTLVRRELSLKLSFARTGVGLALLLSVVWLGTALDSPPRWLPTLGLRGGGPFSYVMAAVFLGYAVYLLTITLPKLRRQRAELD